MSPVQQSKLNPRCLGVRLQLTWSRGPAGQTTRDRRSNMSDAGQHRGKHEREIDQDTVEDLQPQEDESAELKGGWSGGVGDPLHTQSKS
jgi:hypothetical protein